MYTNAKRRQILPALATALLSLPAFAAAPTAAPARQPSELKQQLSNLSAESFSDRQAAVKHLQAIIADQIRQRAEIDELLATLQADLLNQTRALALVSDEEARQQTTSLLQMEAGLVAWTVDAMAAPKPDRDALLTWGLSPAAAPILAKLYGTDLRARLAAIKTLAALPDTDAPGVDWTLSRLMNADNEGMRIAAMAAAYDRKVTQPLADAAWFRAIAARQAQENPEVADTGGADIAIQFPGRDAFTVSFDQDTSDQDYALALLVHWHSPLVEARVKQLVADHIKKADDFSNTSEQRLVEAYKVRAAIPLLAADALGSINNRTETHNGQAAATNRTSAAGALCTILDLDPDTFSLLAADPDEELAWCTPGQSDNAAVKKFYEWWSVHHAEYGVKRKPAPPQMDEDNQAPNPNVPQPAVEGPPPVEPTPPATAP